MEKSLHLEKAQNNINSVHYQDLDNDKEPDVEDADDDKYRKIVRRLFVGFNRDYYKPKVIDRGFVGEFNNYIKYMSKGDKDEKLSPEEYLNMIRPYLRDLINKHKPEEELNNNSNNNNNADNNNNNNNKKNNNFQNALDDALDYQTIETHPERISKLKPYINRYNWKGIEFPAGSKEWQKFEQNNKTIALNILHVKHNTKKYVLHIDQNITISVKNK